MSSIVAYAEFLLHINQINISVTLPSNCTEETSIKLSADYSVTVIQHLGEEISFRLPCQVAHDATFAVPLPKACELSYRLRVALDPQTTQIKLFPEVDDVLWPASSLTSGTQIACQHCKNILVDGRISGWKDLPSENWAEMMDFWHCHKPASEDSQTMNASGSTKGYAASNGLVPSEGVGLVDVSHVYLVRGNCIGIQVGVSSHLSYQFLSSSVS